MRYADFIRKVEARAAGGLEPERAEDVTRAVLGALADCLRPDVGQRLAAQLPKQLHPALRAARVAGSQPQADFFIARVCERGGLSRSEAFDHTRAVLNVLAEAVTGRELEHVRSELPVSFETLFMPPAAARWPEMHAPRPDS